MPRPSRQSNAIMNACSIVVLATVLSFSKRAWRSRRAELTILKQ
jgi:hypothetical protein